MLSRLRAELKKAADPAKAPGMQAYMKSAMPYHGVTVPILRRVCRAFFSGYPFSSPARWRRDVLSIWRGARFREERYAAINLAAQRGAAAFQTMDALPMYESMIVSGAWWDTVDEIATHRLSVLLENDPRPMKRTMLAWSRSDNMWKRRSSIICQVPFKSRTDFDLLVRCIEPSLASKEFFLRKAIGWSLRQVAWSRPKEVIRYVRDHGDELSGLSRREALKNVIR